MSFKPPSTTSEYQERTAMLFRAKEKEFSRYLIDNGAKIVSVCTSWEVLRYTAWSDAQPDKSKRPVTCVVYRKTDGRITFTGDSFTHFNRFLTGAPLDCQDRQIALDHKRAHSGKAPPSVPKLSWAKRTRLLLHERDGDDCYFCCDPLSHMNADHLRGGETIEHLFAQSLAAEAGWSPGEVNHIDNLVLAHARCNREAGHKTVAEKEAIRAMHQEGLKSDVPWWEEPGFVSDAPLPVPLPVNPRPRNRGGIAS
jgi:5-methylcytosine-specific restriction endonuclease McrA